MDDRRKSKEEQEQDRIAEQVLGKSPAEIQEWLTENGFGGLMERIEDQLKESDPEMYQ